jgi:hypothetical protein
MDKGPYVYWYQMEEISQLLRKSGFKIVATGTRFQINQGVLYESSEELLHEPIDGMLYFVAKK